MRAPPPLARPLPGTPRTHKLPFVLLSAEPLPLHPDAPLLLVETLVTLGCLLLPVPVKQTAKRQKGGFCPVSRAHTFSIARAIEILWARDTGESRPQGAVT